MLRHESEWKLIGISGLIVSGYDANARLIEEEDSACPTLLEQDFNRYHNAIPGLRRSGVDANAIRQVSWSISQQEAHFKALLCLLS